MPANGQAFDPPSSEMSPRLVEDGLPKVPGEGRLLAQGIELAEGPKEGLLNEVLGDLPDACQHVGEPERPKGVGLVQLSQVPLPVADCSPFRGP